MTTNDLKQIKQIVAEVTQPQFTQLSHKIDKVHHDLKGYIAEVDKRVFHVDQRLTRIEYKLGIPTPEFDPNQPIQSVFVNPIKP